MVYSIEDVILNFILSVFGNNKKDWLEKLDDYLLWSEHMDIVLKIDSLIEKFINRKNIKCYLFNSKAGDFNDYQEMKIHLFTSGYSVLFDTKIQEYIMTKDKRYRFDDTACVLYVDKNYNLVKTQEDEVRDSKLKTEYEKYRKNVKERASKGGRERVKVDKLMFEEYFNELLCFKGFNIQRKGDNNDINYSHTVKLLLNKHTEELEKRFKILKKDNYYRTLTKWLKETYTSC